MHLSIIIPAYNEENRLGSSLDKILHHMSAKPYEREVLVVNDGSKDKTSAVAHAHEDDFRKAGVTLRVIENPGNRGKGYSVRNGIMAATGEIVLFTDADLSAPIEEADRLLAPVESGDYEIVLASRGLPDSVIPVHQSVLRETAGRTFNVLMRTIVGLPFKDTQCGFKAFHRERTLPIFAHQQIERFGFDPELLYIAKKYGLRMLELPITWSHVEGSKVGLFSDATRMFSDLITIRWNDVRGKY